MKCIQVMSVAAVVLPVALAAQAPAPAPQPPVANPITQSFRVFAGHYALWIEAAFDSIPESRYGYKPTPPQMTIGDIAQHLENANYELCARFGELKAPAAAGDSVIADSIKAVWPKDTLITRYKASLVFCDSAIARVNDTKLADQVSLDAATGRTVLRSRLLLAFVTDLAEHYSQIASYMRIIGMVPPSALPRPKS
jgi:hypothetical protein